MPNVLDIWEATRTVRGKQIELELVDTSGDPYLQVDRQIKYSKADGFMLCAAVNAMSSFENVEKWVQEISVIQTAPIVLIVTKNDLVPFLVDAETDHVTEEMAEEKKNQMNFTQLCYTSSKDWNDYNVHKAFDDAIAAAYYLKYNEDL